MLKSISIGVKRYLEIIILTSFTLGILIGMSNPDYGFLDVINELFIKFFVLFSPIIIFLLIFLSSSKIVRGIGSSPIIGGKVLLYTLLYSYIAVIIATFYSLFFIRSLEVDPFKLFLMELIHIAPKILTSPLVISIISSISLPLILRRYIVENGDFLDRLYDIVIRSFRSIIFIMPIITFSFGYHLYVISKDIFIEYLIDSIKVELIYGITYLGLSSIFTAIYSGVSVRRIFLYSLKTFISCIPAGGSYMALPINLKIYGEIFGDDVLGTLALSMGASINRAASAGGAIIILEITSIYTGLNIGLGRLIALGILIPFIALGSPGIFGGTLIVGISIIPEILGISPDHPLATLSLAMFISVLTYILAPLNTLTNGLIGIDLQKKR